MKHQWICEICGKAFDYEHHAESCERSHPKPEAYKVDKVVFTTHRDIPERVYITHIDAGMYEQGIWYRREIGQP